MAVEKVIRMDVRNERTVLATLMRLPLDDRGRWTASLDEQEFLDPRHRVLFRILCRMGERGFAWSEDTCELVAGGADFGGIPYLRKVLAEYEANANLAAHVERLKTDALKWELLNDYVPSLIGAIEASKTSREDLWGPVRRLQRRVERDLHLPGRHSGALVEGFYGLLAERKALPEYVSTGFPELDERLTFGFAPGHLTLLVARPGVGKSTALGQMVLRRARQHLGTRIFALDMAYSDYVEILVAGETGIPQQRLVREVASLTIEEKRAIRDAVERYRDPKILSVVENPFAGGEGGLPPWKRNEKNLELFESYLAEGGYPLVAVDVANQLLADRRPEAVRDSVGALIHLARTYHVHLLILHHTGRDQEGRPTLEDIRSSGGWEEFCKTILALDRPGMRRKTQRDVVDFGCLKQTKGPAPWWIRYDFDGARCQFENGRVLSMLSGGKEPEEAGDNGV